MKKIIKILFVCEGNSCRSQIAEGYLNELGNNEVIAYSAGTHPGIIDPIAIEVMQEDNIDISKGYAKNINIFLNEKFDYIITLCDEARDHCPHFSTKNNNIFHKSFKSPKKEDKKDYRRVRDEIKQYVQRLYSEIIQ